VFDTFVSIPYRCNETRESMQKKDADGEVSIPYRCNETLPIVGMFLPHLGFNSL